MSNDPAGRIQHEVVSFRKTAGRFNFAFEPGITTYTEHGDWFAWSCLALAAWLVLFAAATSKAKPKKKD